MSKPSYKGAKTYFLILEAFAFVVFAFGSLMAVIFYQNFGTLLGIGAAAGSFVSFLALIAVSQIGRATIHTAEDTRRMADMMAADRKSPKRVNGAAPSVEIPASTTSEKLVARR